MVVKNGFQLPDLPLWFLLKTVELWLQLVTLTDKLLKTLSFLNDLQFKSQFPPGSQAAVN